MAISGIFSRWGRLYIYMLDPSYVKNCAPEDLHLHLGGGESP